MSTFYTNRALCLLKLHDAQGAMADSLQALALEPSSVKAQVFLGQAHLELDNLDEAFEHLQLGEVFLVSIKWLVLFSTVAQFHYSTQNGSGAKSHVWR